MRERELDALIAKHVFGLGPDAFHYKVSAHSNGCSCSSGFNLPYLEAVAHRASLNADHRSQKAWGDFELEPTDLPNYSTEIADAWLVVEKLDADYFDFNLYRDGGLSPWFASFTKNGQSYESEAGTAPLAIVDAALKSRGVDWFAMSESAALAAAPKGEEDAR